MPARVATAVRTQQKSQRELEDLQLVMRVHNGDERARETLIQRYNGFVRMKASSSPLWTRMTSCKSSSSR